MNPDNQHIVLQKVWGEKAPELIEEIVATWNKHKALPPSVTPHDRARQVVMLARNETREIIGITTAARFHYKPLKNDFFALRGMLIPAYRIPGLFIKMMINTIETLETVSKNSSENGKPIGVIAEVEAPGLKEGRLTRLASGMTLTGFSSQDHPIYTYYFKGATY